MPSVTIGDNCVVGAGSIVTKSIASDSVVAGCPARPIRTIQEYRKKVEQKAVHIRSLRAADKRDILLRRFSTHEASSIRP
jgi:serine acetyltransferase